MGLFSNSRNKASKNNKLPEEPVEKKIKPYMKLVEKCSCRGTGWIDIEIQSNGWGSKQYIHTPCVCNKKFKK